MIISASYRTDIPAFYGDWFQHRLKAGFAKVTNPYGSRPYRLDLRAPAVDGFVFWTKNAAAFLGVLEDMRSQDRAFVVQYTINGYPSVLETSVIEPDQSIESVRRIVELAGPDSVVWRYDPVLLSSLTPAGWHLTNFARLANGLAGLVDEVVLSFAHIYRKTHVNTQRAAERHGFEWWDPELEERRALLANLAAIAGDHGLTTSLCAQPDLLGEGLAAARCIDVARLERVAGRPISARQKGNRAGCLCAESRDIGAYDTCPHGCVYCYAVRDPALAKRRFRDRDPQANKL